MRLRASTVARSTWNIGGLLLVSRRCRSSSPRRLRRTRGTEAAALVGVLASRKGARGARPRLPVLLLPGAGGDVPAAIALTGRRSNSGVRKDSLGYAEATSDLRPVRNQTPIAQSTATTMPAMARLMWWWVDPARYPGNHVGSLPDGVAK